MLQANMTVSPYQVAIQYIPHSGVVMYVNGHAMALFQNYVQ